MVPSEPAYSCPSSWNLYGASCYQRWEQQKTWTQAENLCGAQGGHLTSIETVVENAFVRSLVSSGPTWIGMHEPGKEGVRVWSDGSAVNYTNWGNGQPNNVSRENVQDCVLMRVNGRWFDNSCIKNHSYVCEINATLVTTAAAISSSQPTHDLSPDATTVTVTQALISYASTRSADTPTTTYPSI